MTTAGARALGASDADAQNALDRISKSRRQLRRHHTSPRRYAEMKVLYHIAPRAAFGQADTECTIFAIGCVK